jgi:serine/threonine protein kinase
MVEHAEQWVEKDGDFVFDKTKIILRRGDSVFMATTDKMESGLKESDLKELDRIRIPPEHFCPAFRDGLTLASKPVSAEIYVKRPRLLSWHPEDDGSIAALVLQEAEVCELLRQHPHPNIAQYHGCLVDSGRITGLCFTNYTSDLQKTLTERKDISEKEKVAYSKGIEDGIRHLHQLGLAHNDINPSNIMMAGEKPVVIDFDSMRPIGEKLAEKGGTFQWELEGAEFSEPENDWHGLNKIQEVTLQVKAAQEITFIQV